MSWTTHRAKFFYDVIDRRTGNDHPPLLAVSIHHGVVPRSMLTADLPRAEDLSNYKLCEPGDIVLNRMRAFQGAIGISPLRGIVSPDYMVLRPASTVEPRFLHHLFRSSWFVGEMIARLRGIGGTESGAVRTPRINAEDLGDISAAIPSIDEQRRIADFLDAETAQIDQLTATARTAISRLDEKRQTTIDNILSFKPTTRLKYLVRIVDTTHKTAPESPGGGYWIAGTGSVRRGRLHPESLYEIGSATYREWTLRMIPRPGDVLMTREAPVGEVALYEESHPSLAIGQRMVLIRPYADLTSGEYLLLSLMTTRTRQFIDLATQGSLHPHLNVGEIGDIPVCDIPRSEQNEVTAQIASNVRKIDDCAERYHQLLALLAERRQALITAAVTGQIDVTTARGADLS